MEVLTVILAATTLTLLWALYILNIKRLKYQERLRSKDRIINSMIRALPALFVENYRCPDPMKERDGEFVFYCETRPEYDGRFVSIKWICEGKEKQKYNDLIFKYFKYLESMGLEVHPVLLGDRPYSGRIMIDSYYELDEEETQTMEELKESVTRDVRSGTDVPMC